MSDNIYDEVMRMHDRFFDEVDPPVLMSARRLYMGTGKMPDPSEDIWDRLVDRSYEMRILPIERPETQLERINRKVRQRMSGIMP